VFEDLTARRGAVYVRNGATLVATNTTFRNNTSTTFGGAISSFSTATITLEGCTLESNTAKEYGGAMGFYSKGNTVTVTGSTFSKNTSGTYGGVMATRDNKDVVGGSYTFSDCEFTENESGSSAGVMYLRGDSTTKSSFTGCDFADNAAGTHSGVTYIYNGTHGFKDCTFTGNSATTAGEAALKATSYVKMTLDGCTFADNSDYDIYNYNMTLTLKNKNNINSIFLRTAVDSKTGEQLYRSVAPDATFTTDAPIALIPQGGAGHAAITGNIEANLANFFVAKTDGTADATLTIGSDGTVVAAE
jgi:predicted outer membrane repeat protein